MKYNFGDRLIWIDNFPTIRGVVIRKKHDHIRKCWLIDVRWENGRVLTYSEKHIDMNRLQIDKEYYRNEKLKTLGI
jgi:hypothetical protein